MKAAFAVVLTLCLAGCGRSPPPCSAAEKVRVNIDGKAFAIPVDLMPSIIGAPEKARLPSYAHRDAQGRWAYCQTPSEKPAPTTTLSFYPRIPGAKDVSFLIVEPAADLRRPAPSLFPMHEDARFDVTVTKGSTYVFSPAGGVRATPVSALCASSENGPLKSCRVSFVTQSGTGVRFDIVGRHPLSGWSDVISKVEAYITGFEMGG